MKKLLAVLTVLILVGIFVPAVSAEEIYNESVVDYTDTSQTVLITTGDYTHDWPDLVNYPVNKIRIRDVSSWDAVGYIVLDIPHASGTYSVDNCPGWWVDSQQNIASGRYDFTYEYNGKSKPGVLYLERYTNLFGTPTHTRFTIFLNDWDRDNLEGTQIVTLPFSITAIPDIPSIDVGTFNIQNIDQNDVAFVSDIYTYSTTGGRVYLTIWGNAPSISIAKGVNWEQHLTVKKIDVEWYEITLDRAVNGILTKSTIEIYNDSVVVAANTGYGDTFTSVHRDTNIDTIKIVSPSNREYYYNLESGDPDDPTDPDESDVTVYVQNSQTGALLADAHIEIQDTTTEPWTEVVNQTLTSGQGTISLAKDSGIHFTQYRIGATVPGYQQVVPALFFRVTGPTNVIVEMEPTSGGPEDENNTFLEFYVRDISANAIANANVQVDGQLRWTNAQGYTQFEVPKNASYPYSVTKTGYLTIEGIASVENDDRYIVNVALMAGAVPTQPTVSPTITVEPTPTQTSPIQEDNLIGLSVRGLAKGFGIDYDTALLLFGLMIIFGAGGMVMSSVKGGAMEFIAGSIVGTFVAFALGLIPIWIFIIIAVVFGAYVLRVFVQGGE